jgi:superfamily II RNA helicase
MADTTNDPELVDEGPNGAGSLGRLAPDWAVEDPHIPLDDSLETFLEWVEARGITLWEHQEEALLDIASGDNVILGTPTGSGKSMVALGMCFMAMCAGERSYYTAPIKALVSEKFFNLVDLLGQENVGMITGDVVINSEAPVICCTAEILAQDALRFGEDADIGFVAMDEFHFYADHDRGWAWQVPLLTLPHVQFLLMSATLGDTTQISETLELHTGKPVDDVSQAERPIPLSYQFVDTALEATVELALKNGDAPIYIVHFAQDAALASAQSLASYGVSTREQRDAIKEAIKGTRFTTTFGKTLRRLLGQGVGVHHAGMLPRYRLLVEKLAQQGLLPVICGTDTLGVGINVPIHTVLLTQLTKYDGRRQRRLNAREFHQIAGRAGRSGYDTEGMVIAEATEYDIDKARALRKAGGDPKKAKSIKTKKPREGFVGWNKNTFDHLIEAQPETLKPHLRITHSMVLAEVEQGGDAWARTHKLVEDSNQTPEEKVQLGTRVDEVFATLMDAGVVEKTTDDEGNDSYAVTVDLPEDFALDQPLSPFLLAALELLDPESETYALDLISMVESTLENPYQILRAQERQARDRAWEEMKADGVDFEERKERLEDVTYPKPLEELLLAAFGRYCEDVPWAADYELSPKSILRDMVERAADFKGYCATYNIARSEGLLLRYLSDAYRVLDRTIPLDKRNNQLDDIVSWLRLVVRTVDSSLVDEWENSGTDDGSGTELAAPQLEEEVVHDRRALTVLVRNALFARVRLAAHGKFDRLGEMDADWGWRAPRWKEAIDAYFAEHDELLLDADARSNAYLVIDEKDERPLHVWHVTQIFHDADGDGDFRIAADVKLDETQDEGEVVFDNYRVGFVEDL